VEKRRKRRVDRRMGVAQGDKKIHRRSDRLEETAREGLRGREEKTEVCQK
jgi:hypothetical protein